MREKKQKWKKLYENQMNLENEIKKIKTGQSRAEQSRAADGRNRKILNRKIRRIFEQKFLEKEIFMKY